MAVKLAIHAAPKASRSEVVGWQGDALKVRLAAPPVDGAANKELTVCLAKFLGLPKSAVTLTGGASSKRKMVEIEGLSEGELADKLPPK